MAELEESLLFLTKEQFGLRMQRSTGQLNQPHLMKQVRRDIARIKTLLTQMSATEEGLGASVNE